MFRALRALFGGKSAGEASAASQPESRYLVTVDDSGVTCKRPDGKTESVAWQQLRQVLIEYAEDHLGVDVWVLLAEGTGCVVPIGTQAEGRLREAFKARLPGFDWKTALDAARIQRSSASMASACLLTRSCCGWAASLPAYAKHLAAARRRARR